MTTNKKPAFEAFTVREGSKGKSYFTRVGAAWPTKNGNGVTLYLDALPVDGKLILMPPKAKQEGRCDRQRRWRLHRRRRKFHQPDVTHRRRPARVAAFNLKQWI